MRRLILVISLLTASPAMGLMSTIDRDGPPPHPMPPLWDEPYGGSVMGVDHPTTPVPDPDEATGAEPEGLWIYGTVGATGSEQP